jgi:hypothetical protein
MNKKTSVGFAATVLSPVPDHQARHPARNSNFPSLSKYWHTGLLMVLLLSVLPLAGCFKSDKPLITIFDSVTPIPEGSYTYVDTNKVTHSIIITHDWNTTKVISVGADGSPKLERFLMVKLDKGYYIAMDAENDYTLIHVNSKNFIVFDATKLGDKLVALAQSEGKNISDYGVVRVTGESFHICWFDDLDGLKRAMAALGNSGTKMPNGDFLVNGLVIGRIFERQ